MLKLLLALKKFSPFAAIKRRLRASEFILDAIYYYKTKQVFKERHFKAFNRFKIDYHKDLALVFFVGIGDAIYGLPMFLELKKKLHSKGAKFHAYVEEASSNFNNPAVYHVLCASGIFDSVSYFHGRKLPYWKYFDWTSIKIAEDIRVLPFIYRTNSKVKDRIAETFRQFSLEPVIIWPNFRRVEGNTFRSLVEVISSSNNKNIFIHLETRSGDYTYPFLDDFLQLAVSSKILFDKMNLIVFTSNNQKKLSIRRHFFEGQSAVTGYQNFESIEFMNGNKIIFLDPINIQFDDQILLIENYCDMLLAINSYLWPISKMLNKELIGIHYLDSADGHQFLNEDSFVITPSERAYKKLGNGFLALEGVDYRRLPSNPLMVEYFPETIYWALIQRMHHISGA
jgi:hypothetical protein